MERSIITLSLTLVGLAGVARANPIYARHLDEGTIATARENVVEMLTSAGKSTDLADIMLRLDAWATSSDTGCPGIDVDVLNASDHTMWAVEVKVEQKDNGKERTDIVHLPYLPAMTKTRVTVACVENYTYGSRYGSYATQEPIQLNYIAKSKRVLSEALTAMIATKVDASLAYNVEPKAGGTQNLLEAALAMNDGAIAHELVLAIATTGIGARELGDAIAHNGALADNVIADEVAKSISSLPPGQQAKLARVLLASPTAEQWAATLGPLIDKKLCSGPRPDAVALWIIAQGDTGIPVAALRDKVRAKCLILPTDGPALVVALDRDAKHAGSALDAVDPALFAGALGSWKKTLASKDGDLEVPLSLLGFLADTGDAKRFDDAIAVVPAVMVPETITSIVQGGGDAKPEATAVEEHKAEWVAAAIGKLTQDTADDLVRELFERLVDGRIKHPTMRAAVRATRARAPGVADGVVGAYTDSHSSVYDSKKLADAKVDLIDYLAFATASLDGCDASIERLTECADDIATQKSLVKAGDALKPEFTTAMERVLTMNSKDQMVEASKHLDKAGISVKFIVDRLCTDAQDALRYDGDYDAPLAYVKDVPGGDACIASIADSVASKHRTAIIMTILAICALILPIPIGGLFVRRRWRKLVAAMPAVETESATAGGRLDDRLGAHGLGRALDTAVNEARRETKLPGLTAVDAAMVERVAITVRRAVKSGDAASVLAKAGGQAIYIVALPIRHARPQIVQRYLGAEWPDHLEAIRLAAGSPVTALVVLCGPDAAEATLLVGFSDGVTKSDPDALLDAREARDRGANTFRGVMSLTVAAPLATPTTAIAAAK